MRRPGGFRGVAVVFALACVFALGFAALAFGLPSEAGSPSLGSVTRATVEARINEAIKLEETAFHFIDHDAVAEKALRESIDKMYSPENTLKGNGGAGRAVSALESAQSYDRDAIDYLKKQEFHKARTVVAAALRAKEFALDYVTAPPPPPPPPSTSALADCVFESAQGQEEVKVSWTGEGGAALTVIFGFGSSTAQTKTGTLNTAGIGYVGPFTVSPGATYPVVIQASNPTTGKTASATTGAGIGPTTTPASDCKIGG